MSKDLTKQTDPKAAPKRPADAASRLKTALMEDALGRVLGKDGGVGVVGQREDDVRLPRYGLLLAVFTKHAPDCVSHQLSLEAACHVPGLLRCRLRTGSLR